MLRDELLILSQEVWRNFCGSFMSALIFAGSNGLRGFVDAVRAQIPCTPAPEGEALSASAFGSGVGRIGRCRAGMWIMSALGHLVLAGLATSLELFALRRFLLAIEPLTIP